MTNIELNEQLVKLTGHMFREGFWKLSDGSGFFTLPDFCSSLDLQAKWLWPTLREKGYHLELTQWDDTFHAQLLDRLGNETDFMDCDCNPAKACALAITKLGKYLREAKND